MKHTILIALLALALPLAAQPPEQPKATPEQLQQFTTVMRQQRDFATQALQDTQAQLQLVAKENEALKTQVAELEKKLAAADKPAAKDVPKTAANSDPKPQPKS